MKFTQLRNADKGDDSLHASLLVGKGNRRPLNARCLTLHGSYSFTEMGDKTDLSESLERFCTQTRECMLMKSKLKAVWYKFEFKDLIANIVDCDVKPQILVSLKAIH